MANMNDLTNLNALFAEKLFRVPDYQRGYSWQKPQLEDFFEDLMNLKPDKNHYTGMLTLKKISEQSAIDRALNENDKRLVKNNFSVYHIVDGQQRLTTAIILINEMVKFFKKNGISSVRDGIELRDDILQKYICRFLTSGSARTTAYIFGYSKDDSSYDYLKYSIFEHEKIPAGVTLNQTAYTRNLHDAKKFFADILKNLGKSGAPGVVEEIYRKLVLNLKFNIYEISDEYDVSIAFETMNNRGKSLSVLELLKNRLIYLTTILGGDNENLREEISLAWKEIYTWLGKKASRPISDDNFLKAHWIVYYRANQQRSGDDANKFLLEKFSTKNAEGVHTLAPSTSKINAAEIQSYVQSLQEIAKYYFFTYFPDAADPANDFDAEEKIWVKRFNFMEKEFLRPLIMVAAYLGSGDGKRLKLLKAIERFIFVRFYLSSRRNDAGASTYYNLAKELYKRHINFENVTATIEDEIAGELDSSVRNFVNAVEENFKSGEGFYSWAPLKYVLYEYEYDLSKKNQRDALPDWEGILPHKRDKISIEHILPQTLDCFSQDWSTIFAQYDDEQLKYLTGALGNLLLLNQNINASYQNDSFEEKVDPSIHKRASGYRQGSNSEREVVKIAEDGSGTWTAQEIKRRTEILIDFIAERWNLQISDAQRQILIHLDFVS